MCRTWKPGLPFIAMALRTETAAGLRLPESDAELVLQTEDPRQEVDLLVEAARRVEAAGGKVIVPPFDFQIGRCVLEDPWAIRWFCWIQAKDFSKPMPMEM